LESVIILVEILNVIIIIIIIIIIVLFINYLIRKDKESFFNFSKSFTVVLIIKFALILLILRQKQK
jgi:hypothetical protein